MWWHSIVCSLSLLCRCWVSSVVLCTSGGVIIDMVYLLLWCTYWGCVLIGGILIVAVYLLRLCTYWWLLIDVVYLLDMVSLLLDVLSWLFTFIDDDWWFGWCTFDMWFLTWGGYLSLTLSYDLGIRFVLGSCMMIGYVELVLDWVFLFFGLFYLLE